MVLPFIETPYGKVHSDPVEFTIGSKDSSELLDFEKIYDLILELQKN
jgi:hypothetical protein